jgi:hypothetical protein
MIREDSYDGMNNFLARACVDLDGASLFCRGLHVRYLILPQESSKEVLFNANTDFVWLLAT